MPNQITETVIMATAGMKRKNSVQGSSSARTGRKEPMARPTGTPTALPMAKPWRMRRRLAATCSWRMPSSTRTTARSSTGQGGGNSAERTSSAAATCHTANSRAKPAR